MLLKNIIFQILFMCFSLFVLSQQELEQDLDALDASLQIQTDEFIEDVEETFTDSSTSNSNSITTSENSGVDFSDVVVDEDLNASDFEDDITNNNIANNSTPMPTGPIGASDFEDDLPPPVVVSEEVVQAPIADLSTANKIIGLEFFPLQDRVRTIISFEKDVVWNTQTVVERSQVILNFPDSYVGESILTKHLDTGEYNGPVAFIKAYDYRASTKPTAKILVQLRTYYEPTITKGVGKLYIDFPIASSLNLVQQNPLQSYTNMNGQNSMTPQSGSSLPTTFLTLSNDQKFTGKKMTLKLKDAELKDVLNLISEVSGKNFVIAQNSESKVTLNVENTPWDQVFSIILLNAKLGYQKIGDTYRIVSQADLKQEIELAAEASQKLSDLSPLITKLIPVNYASATEIRQNFESLKSERGKFSVDTRVNSVVVTDSAENIRKIENYIKSVDVQTPQVLIESRIVIAKETFAESNGILWKMLGSTPSSFGGSQKGIDFETTKDSGSFSFFGNNLGFFNNITATLNLFEKDGLVKSISRPRISVLNNKTATISQGETFFIPTQQSNSSGSEDTTEITQESVKVALTLQVTPQVSSDGFVSLKIDLTKDNRSSSSSSDIDTRKATTELLVESGKTAVIGGIYVEDDSFDNDGVPYLKNLPIVGRLFSMKTKSKDKSELLMFISPTILNAQKSLITEGYIGNEKSTIQGLDATRPSTL